MDLDSLDFNQLWAMDDEPDCTDSLSPDSSEEMPTPSYSPKAASDDQVMNTGLVTLGENALDDFSVSKSMPTQSVSEMLLISRGVASLIPKSTRILSKRTGDVQAGQESKAPRKCGLQAVFEDELEISPSLAEDEYFLSDSDDDDIECRSIPIIRAKDVEIKTKMLYPHSYMEFLDNSRINSTLLNPDVHSRLRAETSFSYRR